MITKVFQSGYSQAVRIPVGFRLDIDTVEILHGENSDIILRSFKPKADMEFLALFEGFDEDFIEALENRDIAPPQERDSLWFICLIQTFLIYFMKNRPLSVAEKVAKLIPQAQLVMNFVTYAQLLKDANPKKH